MTKRIPEPDRPPPTEPGAPGGTGDADLDAYVRDRDVLARNRLLLRYGRLVARIAARLGPRVPAHLDRADLISSGTLGLLDALTRFDPAAGTSFERFAAVRIRGAMLDEVRATGAAAPRSFWAKRREVDRVATALANSLGRSPLVAELSTATGLTRRDVVRARSGDEPERRPDDELLDRADLAHAAGLDPEESAVESDARARLRSAVDRLPERAYRIVTWYYRDGLTLAGIGLRLGITESRVAQLHTDALDVLRARLQRPTRPPA
ncbi:MAG: sigma-70 family RNA polymerase sigma factor [Streptosporangiales bacterium]|nr:sigma-70 family RNA polymerase sigma factor [Streptosporangiales bacterium]